MSNKPNLSIIIPVALKYKIKSSPSSDISSNTSSNIHFSGSKDNGEGEQKIFEYIRNHQIEGNVFIYGLDADLIMLSLLHLQNADIYLYRETKHFTYIKFMIYKNIANYFYSKS